MKSRILIVDDMPDNTLILMSYLSSQGYDIVTAQNGTEALALLASNLPDLIISDIMMPKMGGFEFVEKLRRNYTAVYIPIIFLSGKGKGMAEQMAFDLGADGFLEKPVSFTVLKATVEAALAKGKTRTAKTITPQDDQKFIEQRKSKRAPFICEAYFEGDGISGFTVATNISTGGLFLDTFSNIPPGTMLNIKLKLKPGCEVEVIGEVRYGVQGSGVGVKFANLNSEAMNLIESLVEGVLTQPQKAVNNTTLDE
jgi:CheY-like chemotaxis protein